MLDAVSGLDSAGPEVIKCWGLFKKRIHSYKYKTRHKRDYFFRIIRSIPITCTFKKLISKTEIELQMLKTNLWLPKGKGGINWETGTDMLIYMPVCIKWGFPGGSVAKELACQCRRCKRCGFDPWVGKIPWRRKWQPILVFLPGKSHG